MLVDIYIIILLFITGLLLGTIGILIGIRRPLGYKKINSKCDKCSEEYSWYELIPIISYFLSKGECPYCKRSITLWYTILEIIAGILFSLSYIIYGFSYEMIAMIILTILSIIIFVSDFKYYTILDGPLLVFSIIILILKYLFYGAKTFLLSLCSGILIFIFMYLVKLIGDAIFKRESLGGGDIKLSMFFGFFIGIRLSIISLVIGSFLAFPYAIYLILVGKEKEIPFGPFLVTGLYITFLLMEYISNFINIVF